jgi:hypothetical protein
MFTIPKSRWLLVLLSMLAALTLILSACGGDDDDDDGGDDGGEPTVTEATDGDNDSGDDSGDDGGDGDSLSELEKLAGSGEDVPGVVTYQIKSEGQADSTWKVYSSGDGKSRIDFESEDGVFVTITTPEASYTCTESAGTGMCFEGEGGEGSNPFAGLFGQYGSADSVTNFLDAYGGTDADTSTEEIAGVDAACYSVSGDLTSDEGTAKWCYSDNGLLLLSSYDYSSGDFEMKAIEYSEDVSDGDFEPPYDITDIPDLGQIGQ